MAKVLCGGWEKLPHDADEDDATIVGSTRLCRDCYGCFLKDPNKEEYSKYL